MPENPHSQKIATERALMEMTGASRTQIRNAAIGTPLRDFINKFRQAQEPVIAPVAAPPPPKIETAEQATKPNAFIAPPGSGNKQSDASPQFGPTVTVDIWVNAEPYTGEIPLSNLTPVT